MGGAPALNIAAYTDVGLPEIAAADAYGLTEAYFAASLGAGWSPL